MELPRAKLNGSVHASIGGLANTTEVSICRGGVLQ
jgi:hypothetical protein